MLIEFGKKSALLRGISRVCISFRNETLQPFLLPPERPPAQPLRHHHNIENPPQRSHRSKQERHQRQSIPLLILLHHLTTRFQFLPISNHPDLQDSLGHPSRRLLTGFLQTVGALGGIRVQERILAGQKGFPRRIRVLSWQCEGNEGEAAAGEGFGEGREEETAVDVEAAEGARKKNRGAFGRPENGRRQRCPEEEGGLQGGHVDDAGGGGGGGGEYRREMRWLATSRRW